MKRILLYGLLLVAISLQAQEPLPYPTDTIDGKVYYRYTVEKSIGLYRISKNFNVTQEAILEANPELRTRGLRYEEVILIPTNLAAKPKKLDPVKAMPDLFRKQAEVPPVAPETAKVQEVTKVQEVAKVQDVRVEEISERSDSVAVLDVPAVQSSMDAEYTTELPVMAADTVVYTDTVRITVLLPLQAELAQRTPALDRFYDFYCGALLALKHQNPTYIDSLGIQHTTYYNVRTYDTDKNAQLLCQLMDSGILAQTDVIIGPAYIKQVSALSDYAMEHKIPVIIPFLQQLTPSKLCENPYLLKFNPSETIHTHALMEHLDTLRSQINIILVDAYTSKMDYSIGIRTLRDSIAARQLPTTHTTIRQILADSVSGVLKDSVENILVFHSERYSNVQLLMPYLLSGKHGKRLTVLSQYAWQSERILLPQLYTSVFRTPDAESIALYDQDFAKYFGHQLSSTLPRYDLLGYDLTRYALQALKDGTFQVKQEIFDGLQSSILFTQTPNGGYENTHIVISR